MSDVLLLESQKSPQITRIPGMSDVCEKVRFHRLLQVIKPFFDTEGLDISVPETFILPDQADLLKKEFRGTAGGPNNGIHGPKKPPTLIIKPEYGTQGTGIFLARGLPDINAHVDKLVASSRRSVAQYYVENPLTYDGLKFDLRLYVVVTEIVPHLKVGESSTTEC